MAFSIKKTQPPGFGTGLHIKSPYKGLLDFFVKMVYNIAPKNKGVGYVFTTGGGFKIFNGR
jgi:hypothetical protein